MELIQTSDKLPGDRQRVLWWNPKFKDWNLGTYYTSRGNDDFGPGYFYSGDSCWYICNGHTTWSPEPPPLAAQ